MAPAYFRREFELADLTEIDGNSRTNLEEFIAGTDPTDPRSRFEIISAVTSSSPPFDVTLTWSSVPGHNYRIMQSADLTNGSWNLVLEKSAEAGSATATTTTTATATATELIAPANSDKEYQFYRIELAD